MAGQPLQRPAGASAEQPWRSSLDSLEATLVEAARAIGELRDNLERESAASAGPVAVPDRQEADEKSERGELSAAPVEQDDQSTPDSPGESSERLTDFERVWQRLESERKDPNADRAEQDDMSTPDGPDESSEPSQPRGLDLLPSSYLMTIEDRDASVDLITLQRGLLTLTSLENIRLVTYAKGVPVISLSYEGELDLERLGEAVGNATGRRCEVISQDGTKLFLRLTPNTDWEEGAA